MRSSKTLSAVSALSLSGCITATPVTIETGVLDVPALNAMTERNVGETIIRKGVIGRFRAITLSTAVTVPGGMMNGIANIVTAPAGTYVLGAQNATLDFYNGGSVKSVGASALGSAPITWPNGGVCTSRGTADIVGVSSIPGICAQGKGVLQVGVMSEVERASVGSQLRELLYNGKSGATVRFSYREYAATADGNAIARPAFTQELTYDLADDKVIGFQSVRVEVLETTNSKIKYKVLHSF